MKASYKRLLRQIGLDPGEAFNIKHPNLKRTDGWSAVGHYEKDFLLAQRLVNELIAKRLIGDSIIGDNSNGDSIIGDNIIGDNTGPPIAMEFGCGLALHAMALSSVSKLVLALDGSRDHCVSATECIKREGLDNVVVYQGSTPSCPEYGALPFKKGSLDHIISVHGFWRKDFPRLLKDWASLLKPRGRLNLVYPKFWLTDANLNEDELNLREYTITQAVKWDGVSWPVLKDLAASNNLDLLYHGHVDELPTSIMTGIIFVSSGIVESKSQYAKLVKDFSLRWQVDNMLLSLIKY